MRHTLSDGGRRCAIGCLMVAGDAPYIVIWWQEVPHRCSDGVRKCAIVGQGVARGFSNILNMIMIYINIIMCLDCNLYVLINKHKIG